MVNIFGPGHHPETGESASRPSQLPTGAAGDRWFVPCDPADPNSGTSIDAEWLNFVLANFREAIRGMGVVENEVDDQMLLKCFQRIAVTGWLNLPIYPEVTSGSGVMGVTNNGGGEIEVNASQSFVHRGWSPHNTTNYSAPQRRMNTIASKTYHVRWQYNAGTPVFVLKDTADSAYNPGALPETHLAFDSKYDDMLVAKVVTSGSNVPTITPLLNKHVLVDQLVWSGKLSEDNNAGNNHAKRTFVNTIDWARTPRLESILRMIDADIHEVSPGNSMDGDIWLHPDGPMPANDGTTESAGFRSIVAAAAANAFRTRYKVGSTVVWDQGRFITLSAYIFAP